MEVPGQPTITLKDLIEYLEQQRADEVKTILENQPSIITPKNITALAKAAVEADSKAIVVTLLKHGLNVNFTLDIIVRSGKGDIIELILDRGADVNEGLYFAVKANNKDAITFLLARGANINTTQRSGKTPLHTAVMQKGCFDLVEFLIEKGADTRILTQNNKTALELFKNTYKGKHDEAMKKEIENIEILLDQHKTKSEFECITGLPDGLSGYSYQIKFFTLYAIMNTKLSVSENSEFGLSTEVKDLVPFDDIYLRKIQKGRTSCEFIQVKQTKKPEFNKISPAKFFTMFKPESKVKERMKGNDSIVKIFVKYNEIQENILDVNTHGVFIHCENATFHSDPSPCLIRADVDVVNDGPLCGVKHKKWVIDPNYLLMEIKFVLLKLIEGSQYLTITDEEFKSMLKKQIEILDNLKTMDVLHERLDCTLWSVKKIANAGINAIRKYQKHLGNCKKEIENATDTEHPIEQVYTENLKLTRLNELSKSFKTDKDIFSYLSKYDDIEIRNKIDKFTKHFCIYTDCPTSDELDEIITKEISEEFKFDIPILITAHCLQYFSKWISNFKNEKGQVFTDRDGKKLFFELGIQMFNMFNKYYMKELQRENIKFIQDNEQVIKFLHDDNKYKILHVITQNTRLHAMNVLQTAVKCTKMQSANRVLDNIICTSSEHVLKSDESMKNLSIACSSSGINLVILEFLDETEDFQKIFEIADYLTNVILINDGIKVITIAKGENKVTTALKCISKDYISYQGIVEFKDLNKDTQEAILHKTVNFENNPNSLITKLKLGDFITMSAACEIINEDILSTLVTNIENINIGYDEPFVSDEYNREYFIPRYVLSIDVRMLQKCDRNLFFVTGITRDELSSKVVIPNEYIHVWAEQKDIRVGIVLTDINSTTTSNTNKEIFAQLSSYKNCYWLDFKEDSLYRKDTNVANDNNFEEILSEYKRAPENIEDKIVILANNPGEGKSTVLTHLAHSIRDKSSNSWIIRIDLRYFADNTQSVSLNDIQFCVDDTDKAVELITIMAAKANSNSTDTNNKLERRLLQGVLNGCGGVGVVLMFDGFDEISPGYKKSTCILLKALIKSNVKQLWVTTRIHLKEYLEEELQVSAHMLASFTEMEQVQFLCKYWRCEFKNYTSTHKEENNINQEKNIIALKNKLSSYLDNMMCNDKDSTALKNLEECRSLLEIQEFVSDRLNLLKYAETSLENWKKSLRNDDFLKVPLNLEMLAKNTIQRQWKVSDFKSIQLFEIYKEFVENKLKIYEENKSTSQSGNQANRDQAEIAAVIYMEMHRELAVRTLFEPSHFLPDLSISSKYQKNNVKITEKLARIGLVKSYGGSVEFVHRTFAEYFFSEYLAIHLNHPYVQSEFIDKVLINDDYHMVRTFFDGFLLERSLQSDNSDDDREQDIDEHRHPFQNILVQSVSEEIISQNNNDDENILHVAVRGGHAQIFSLIFNNIPRVVFFILIRKKSHEGMSIIHLAIINERTDMFNSIVDSVKEPQDSPLFTAFPKNMLTDLILQQDNNMNNTLHLAVSRGLTEICYRILEILKNNSILYTFIRSHNSNYQTILHMAAINGNVDTFNLIIKAAEKNLLPEDLVVTHDRSVQNAVARGDWLHRMCDTAELKEKHDELMADMRKAMITANGIFKEIFKTFMLQRDDTNGETCLHVAARLGHVEICEVILKTLVKHEDVLKDMIIVRNVMEQTALHVGAKNGHIEICKLILEAADWTNTFVDLILKCDKNGDTALHLAAKNGYVHVCKLLLIAANNIDDIKHLTIIQNNDKQTVLDIVVQNDYSDVCDFIVKIAEE